MKKLAIVLTTFTMMLTLTACGSSQCQAEGCENEVYQDGYCEYHYALEVAKDTVSSAANDVLNSIFGG